MALIRSIFQEELDAVSQTLVDLTKMVSDSINKATTSLIDANLSLAEEVITFDEKIDQMGANVSAAHQDPAGRWTCYVQDPNGNYFQIVEGRSWFSASKHPSKCGGVAGAVIGVSDMDKSQRSYQDLLGYEQKVYDEAYKNSKHQGQLGFALDHRCSPPQARADRKH